MNASIGDKCTVNPSGDIGIDQYIRLHFIDQDCLIVKKCKSGLIQVCLAADPKKVISVPETNISLR